MERKRSRRLETFGKKGNALVEPITIVFFLFVMVTVSILLYGFLKDVSNDIQGDPDFSNQTKLVLATAAANHPKIWDSMILFGVVVMWAISIALAFVVDSHPTFIIFSILGLIFLLWASAMISNTYTENIAGDADMISLAGDYPKVSWIMNHLVIVVLTIFGSVAAVLFGKMRG